MEFSYYIKESDNYYNVRDVLKNYFYISSRLLPILKKHDLIKLNNNSIYLDASVKSGDLISFSLDFDEDNSNIIPTKMPLDIVYEDEAFILINKPSNLAIHPTTYHFTDTLSNGLKFYFDANKIHKKIRPVNRLDRNTSGLVIFAKNQYVQEFLIKQMLNNTFKKKYLALLTGKLDSSFGTINAPISRKPGSIIERYVSDDGEVAITHYTVLKEFNDYSLVEFELETGRTHQIRVHSQYLGHTILGDSLYGNESPLINRQALHSYYLKFIHPISRKEMEFKIDLPDDMKKLITLT